MTAYIVGERIRVTSKQWNWNGEAGQVIALRPNGLIRCHLRNGVTSDFYSSEIERIEIVKEIRSKDDPE